MSRHWLSLLTAVVLTVFVWASTAAAQTNIYWNGNGGSDTGSWNTTANWWDTADGTNPVASFSGPTIIANFNATAVTDPQVITLGANQVVQGLVFDGTNTGGDTISGNTLTIDAGGIVDNAGSGADTIGSSILLSSAQTWTNNSTTALTINGGISLSGSITSPTTLMLGGSGTTTISGVISNGGGAGATLGLVYNGSGTLTLTAAGSAGTYSGGTTVYSGTLALGGANNTFSTVGTGPLTINAGGTVDINADNALGTSIPGNMPQIFVNGGTLTLSATTAGDDLWFRSLTMTGGTVNGGGAGAGLDAMFSPTISTAAAAASSTIATNITLDSVTTFNIADGSAATDLLVSGVITGAHGIVKTGAGLMTLSAADTYTGPTLVSGGSLRLAGNGGTVGTLPTSGIVVASGAELQMGAGDVLGYQNTNPVFVFGSLRETVTSSETLFRPIILSGGTITADDTGGNPAAGNAYFNLFGGVIYTAPDSGNSYLALPDGEFSIRLNGATYGSFNIAANSTLNVAAVLGNYIADAGDPLIKNGSGTMVLTAANSYTGATISTAARSGSITRPIRHDHQPGLRLDPGRRQVGFAGKQRRIHRASLGKCHGRRRRKPTAARPQRRHLDNAQRLALSRPRPPAAHLLVGLDPTHGSGAAIVTTISTPDATGIYGGRIVYSSGVANTGYDWATTTSGASPYTLSAYTGYAPLNLSGTDTNNALISASAGSHAARSSPIRSRSMPRAPARASTPAPAA